MANNEIKIPGYEEFLKKGQAMLESEIKKYEAQGFKVREEKENEIKMSKAVLIDPTVKDVSVQRVTFTPNPEYNFDFYIEAHEYPMDERKNPCAYVTGAPLELLAIYPEDRRIQQTPDAATLRAIEYIQGEPLIKALITGHTHLDLVDTFAGKPQITTRGSYEGVVRECILC